jgi:hypothetical protein
MIMFSEVFRCAGVDHDPRHLGMVIAKGGSNMIGVAHDNKAIKVLANTTALSIDEPPAEPIMRQRAKLASDLSQQGVDALYKKAYSPDTYVNPTRVFRVKANRSLDFNSGAKISVYADGRKQAEMPVVVLDTMPIKVAIRNVKVPDGMGSMRFHSAKPLDAAAALKTVNEIWTVQTQMVFEEVAAQPAIIDDGDPKVQQLIAKCLGINDLTYAKLNPAVQATQLAPVFAPHRVADADVTVFCVQQVVGTDKRVANGLALSPHGMIFMSSTHGHSTLAHELGHYLGGKRRNGEWDGHDHTFDYKPYKKGREPELSDEDYRMLMRMGGSGYKIPFDLVDDFRDFRKDFAKK